MTEKVWSDRSVLRSLPNPEREHYEIKIKSDEITFYGAARQPDFAILYLTMYPRDTVIELKSFKNYLVSFRERSFSYERLVNVIFDDLRSVYNPERVRIVMIFKKRGGISSRLTIDSDWKIRGGQEKYKDWIGQSDEW